MNSCILVGAGDFYIESFHYTPSDYLIAIDGGYDTLTTHHLTPNYILGDFDSTTHQSLLTNNAIPYKQFPTQKDDTDMLCGIKHGLEQGYQEFHLYGGTGGERIEHTFANISLLIFLHKQKKQGYLHSKNSIITIIEQEEVEFISATEGFVSLFALDSFVQDVTITGLKYPLEHGALTYAYPIGVSNELTQKPCSIQIGKGMALLVYPTTVSLNRSILL